MESFLRQLAEMLVRIHEVPIGVTAVTAYRTYVDLEHATVPAWLRERHVWSNALDVVREARPPAGRRFIHRDYHPENSLRRAL